MGEGLKRVHDISTRTFVSLNYCSPIRFVVIVSVILRCIFVSGKITLKEFSPFELNLICRWIISDQCQLIGHQSYNSCITHRLDSCIHFFNHIFVSTYLYKREIYITV